MPFSNPWVLSVSDDNSSYLVTVETEFVPGPMPFRDFEFEFEGQCLTCDSNGSGEGGGCFAFRADATQARMIARSLGVSVIDREHLPARLVGRLETKRDAPLGKLRTTVVYTLTNEGQSPAWVNCREQTGNELSHGDPRFVIQLGPAGQTLVSPPYDPWVWMMERQDHLRLGPGESRAFVLDPTAWCEGVRPGSYTIRVTFYAEFYPENWQMIGQGPFGWEEHITHYSLVVAELPIELP